MKARKDYKYTGKKMKIQGRMIPVRSVYIESHKVSVMVPSYIVRIPHGWQLRKQHVKFSPCFWDKGKSPKTSLQKAIKYLKTTKDFNINTGRPHKYKKNERKTKNIKIGCSGVCVYFDIQKCSEAPRLYFSVLYPNDKGIRHYSLGRADLLNRDDIRRGLKNAIGVREYLVSKANKHRGDFPELNNLVYENVGYASEFISDANPRIPWKLIYIEYERRKKILNEKYLKPVTKMRPAWA